MVAAKILPPPLLVNPPAEKLKVGVLVGFMLPIGATGAAPAPTPAPPKVKVGVFKPLFKPTLLLLPPPPPKVKGPGVAD